MTDDEFTADQARPEATKFEKLIGGIIDKAIKKKDEKKAEWLLSRTLGKMRERLEIESKTLRVNMQASAALPSLEQLALENPDLSPAQLESFAQKLEKLKSEIAATRQFEAALPPAIDAEVKSESDV